MTAELEKVCGLYKVACPNCGRPKYIKQLEKVKNGCMKCRKIPVAFASMKIGKA